MYTKKKRSVEEKVTQLFLETNALHEIHKFIAYQEGNISKYSLFILLPKINIIHVLSFGPYKLTVSGPASKVHFVMA